MWIRRPKPWALPERDVTPEPFYRSRRQFLRTALGLGGAAAGLMAGARLRAAGNDAQTLEAPRNPRYRVEGRGITPAAIVGGYNNFYEFTLEKRRVAEVAAGFQTRPWEIEVTGLVEKKFRFDVDDLRKRFALEERVYRMRCVEAWSVVVPWIGFPLGKFVEWAKPRPRAKYLRMVSVLRPGECPGQREMSYYPWPYFEGLRLDEAMNELAFLVLGSYGQILPKANGAPLRLATPWKYGYKSIKAITRFEFTATQPPTFWNTLVPAEYDFPSNVNPAKPHPRWSQATEQDVASGRRIPTLPFNGYAEFVAHLYR